MNFTREQLETIEEMGKLFYQPREIAIVIGVDDAEFETIILSGTTEAFSSYKRGWLDSDIKLRKSTLQAALNGSTPSLQTMENYKRK
jgi:hypothetical protein